MKYHVIMARLAEGQSQLPTSKTFIRAPILPQISPVTSDQLYPTMDIELPFQLRIALEGLVAHSTLSGWTIHGSDKMTTLVMRFKNDKMVDDTEGLVNLPARYRRIPPSQVARDNARAKEWQSINEECQTDISNEIEHSFTTQSDQCKQQDTVESYSESPILVPPKPSPRITRSKSVQSKPKQSQPSPLPPQVDGTTDKTLDNPSQTCSKDKDNDWPDDWFEQMAAGTWSFHMRKPKD